MKTTKILGALLPTFVFCVLITASSCKKTEPAKAEITVVDKGDNRIEGATVYMLCTPVAKNECILNDTQTTDATGKTAHVFDHPAVYGSDDINFAVLRVEAFKEYDSTFTIVKLDAQGQPDTTMVDSFFTRRGEVFIELQVGETAKETVTIIQEE